MSSPGPRIAFLTSSFPRSPRDPTVEYLYRLARKLIRELNAKITVIVPADILPHEFPPENGLTIKPFRYFLPARRQRLAYGSGMPDNLRTGFLPLIQVPLLMIAFLIAGWRSVRCSDLIYAHWLVPSGLVGALLSRGLRKEMILSIHSGGLHFLRRFPGGGRLAGFICSSARRITVTCREQKSLLLQLLPMKLRDEIRPRITVAPMGIEWKEYQDGPDKLQAHRRVQIFTPFVVVFLGRLVPVKGVRVLIGALAGRSDVTLLILGDGRERAALERYARELNVATRFTGPVGRSKKIEYLRLSDIMVQPSLVLKGGATEGVPVSLLEGMAAGLPVIASRAGGIPDVIDDGLDGFLVQPGDREQLRDKIHLLLNDPGLRRRMGEEAREKAQAYDWGKIIPVIGSLFHGLAPHLTESKEIVTR